MLNFLERERAGLKGRWVVLLALIACFAVALVVADQGSTIDRQRTLIRDLWNDSKQLTVMRMQELNRRRAQGKTGDEQAGNGDGNAEKQPAGKGHKGKPDKNAEPQDDGDEDNARPNNTAPQHTEWPDGARVQKAV